MGFSIDLSASDKLTRSSSDEISEKEMISACLNEKSWAQKYLYEKYFPLMMGICLRYSNNQEDAKDICNEAFIKIFRNLQKYKVGTSIEGWMRRIMINTSIDFYRKSIRHRSEDLETVQYKVDDSVDLISSLSAKDILMLIQQLTPSYRAVFNLYAIEGYSHKEVAEQLGITESTSRSNLVKARAKLKELIQILFNEK